MEIIEKIIARIILLIIILSPFLCASLVIFVTRAIYKSQKNIFTSAMYRSSLYSIIVLVFISLLGINYTVNLLSRCSDGFYQLIILIMPLVLIAVYAVSGLSIFFLICIFQLLSSPNKNKIKLIIICLFLLISISIIGVNGPYKYFFTILTEK